MEVHDQAEKKTVAFIGLGRMGEAMAANIRRAGYPLVVWNRTPAKAEPILAAGATLAKTPSAAAAMADIIITSMADDAALTSVVCQPDGILKGLRPGSVHISTSTISPGLSDELDLMHTAEKAHYIAGPVLGRPSAAEAAQLVTFVGGDPHRLEEVRPVITTYAPVILFAGNRPSLANIAKLTANFLVASSIDLMGQSIALAEKSGLSRDLVVQMLSGFFAYPAIKEYVTRVVNRDFDAVGFTLSGGLKDVELMIDAAHKVNLELSSAIAMRSKLRAGIERGWRGKDWSCFTDLDRQ
jgi:3-hydroxyisobutyrate dehydrogenase-like beta-hydroxyacid dehydrogenase